MSFFCENELNDIIQLLACCHLFIQWLLCGLFVRLFGLQVVSSVLPRQLAAPPFSVHNF